MQDDQRLLRSGSAVRESTLDEMAALGVTTVRAFVYWRDVAPDPTATVDPVFDATNPNAYPTGAFEPFDALVRSAYARGIDVILTPTAPLPSWASQCSGSQTVRRSCKPDVAAFQAFVTALGLRYDGAHRDANSVLVPRVTSWAVWNEPNVAAWMTPQYRKVGSRTVPFSPARYRRLLQAAVAALGATGHGGDRILGGETAPIGHTTAPLSRRPVATAEFLRDLFCLSPSNGRLTGTAARDQGCSGDLALGISGVAHHPYARGGSRGPLTPPRPDEITIASPGRLTAIVDAAARLGRLRTKLPIFYTEYGIQSSPPDKSLGVPLTTQAAELNHADYMAYTQGRVGSVAQYLLQDDRPVAGFQTGLRFANGRAKPSLAAYAFPIWVVRSGIYVRVFGQVRPASRRRGGERISIHVRPNGTKVFQTYATVTTNLRGYIFVKLRSKAGTWRLYWQPSTGGPARLSRQAQEASR